MKNIFFCLLLLLSMGLTHAKSFETERWKTANGALVIFYQAMEVPILDINIAFAAGSAHDGAQCGLSALTTRLLNEGNGGLSADVIAERLDRTGAQIALQSDQDKIVLSMRSLISPAELKESSDIFRLILTKPDFPDAAFAREKNQQLLSITQVKESPDILANQTFFQVLYPHHPYGHPIDGEHDTVDKLTVNDVQTFYHRYFVANNAILVLVGAVSAEDAHRLAENLTRDLAPGRPADAIPTAQPLAEALDVEVPFPSSQAMLRMGQLGLPAYTNDYFSLVVGNYILGGGGLVSRLSHEIRERRGLAYSVGSQFIPMLGTGPFLISLSTQKQQTMKAADITRKTLKRFVESGPSEEELIAAKQYLTGSFPLSLASNRSIADNLLQIAFYQFPDDFLETYLAKINEVTSQGVHQAFQKNIHPDNLLQISVGSP